MTTQAQQQVLTVLEQLGFEFIPDNGGKTGGDHRYRLPSEKAKELEKGTVVLKPDGSIEIC